MSNQEVTIIIDKKDKKSPNPTIGHALYVLGEIDANTFDLFREVPGKGEDEKIPNDNTTENLKNGEHFFSVPKKLNPGA